MCWETVGIELVNGKPYPLYKSRDVEWDDIPNTEVQEGAGFRVKLQYALLAAGRLSPTRLPITARAGIAACGTSFANPSEASARYRNAAVGSGFPVGVGPRRNACASGG